MSRNVEEDTTKTTALDRLKTHLTYANVMSTIAVSLALSGGVVIAADKIKGSQIKNRSIASKKLKRNAKAPRAAVAKRALVSDRTSQLLLSGTSSDVARGSGQANVAGAADAGPLVRLNAGEGRTLFEKEPFTFGARCSAAGANGHRVEVVVTSTEDNWTNESLKTFPANQSVTVRSWVSDEPTFILQTPIVALAPSGAALTTGEVETGVNSLGSDCAVNIYAVG